MTILSQIDALRNSLTNAYNTIDTKGGTIPQNKNVVNLSNAISSIPTGGGGGTTVSQYGAIYKPASSQMIIKTSQVQECNPIIEDWSKAYGTYLNASDPYMESEMGVQFSYGEDWEQGGWSWILNIASTGEQRKYTNEEMLSECGISVVGTEGHWSGFNLNVISDYKNHTPQTKIEFATASDFSTFINYLSDRTVGHSMLPLGNGFWVQNIAAERGISGVEIGPSTTGIPTYGLANLHSVYLLDFSGATGLTTDSIQGYAFDSCGIVVPSGVTRTFKVGNIPATVASATAFYGISGGKWTCYGEKRAEWVAKFPNYLIDGGE